MGLIMKVGQAFPITEVEGQSRVAHRMELAVRPPRRPVAIPPVTQAAGVPFPRLCSTRLDARITYIFNLGQELHKTKTGDHDMSLVAKYTPTMTSRCARNVPTCMNVLGRFRLRQTPHHLHHRRAMVTLSLRRWYNLMEGIE